MTDCKTLRKKMLGLRNALSPEERDSLNRELFLAFRTLLDAETPEAVLLFASFGTEPDTFPMMEYTLQNGIPLFLPRVFSDGRMEFYRIHRISDLYPGYKGILEPAAEEEIRFEIQLRNKDAKVLLFVPGLAVDKTGNRIGYGGGFYDRYLKRMREEKRNKLAVYLGFPFQKVSEPLPVTEWDEPVDKLIFDI